MPTDYVDMICVGGSAAGQIVQVDRNQDSVKVIIESETEAELKFGSSSTSPAPINYETYTVRTFAQKSRYLTTKIRYLALPNWTDMQALNHLLEYYRNRMGQ